MIRIEYEKYKNDFEFRYETKEFESLQALEDWMFGLLKQPATNDFAMFFPKKDSICRISIHPQRGSLYYWIHSIYYNGNCVFTDGKNETGQKFMATAIDKWLERCRERQFCKKAFIDIEDID